MFGEGGRAFAGVALPGLALADGTLTVFAFATGVRALVAGAFAFAGEAFVLAVAGLALADGIFAVFAFALGARGGVAVGLAFIDAPFALAEAAFALADGALAVFAVAPGGRAVVAGEFAFVFADEAFVLALAEFAFADALFALGPGACPFVAGEFAFADDEFAPLGLGPLLAGSPLAECPFELAAAGPSESLAAASFTCVVCRFAARSFALRSAVARSPSAAPGFASTGPAEILSSGNTAQRADDAPDADAAGPFASGFPFAAALSPPLLDSPSIRPAGGGVGDGGPCSAGACAGSALSWAASVTLSSPPSAAGDFGLASAGGADRAAETERSSDCTQ